MTHVSLKSTPSHTDSLYPFQPQSHDEILSRIRHEGFNALEILPGYVDEWHDPSALFVNILAPSWYRPIRYYEIPTCCYLLRTDTDPSAIGELFVGKLQHKLNCRLSRIELQSSRGVSVGDLENALQLCENQFPSFSAPQKMLPEMQIHDLSRAAGDDHTPINYYTESGQHVHHMIHETYHHFMFEGVNVYGDLAAQGYPLGYGTQRPSGVCGVSLPPSFSLEGAAGDTWDIYLVDDDHDRVANIRGLLQKPFSPEERVEVTTRFPVPVADYRLSRSSLERLEFGEPYVVYCAEDFVELVRML